MMRAFTPSPPIVAFFEALVAQANQAPLTTSGWGGYTWQYLAITLPPIPPQPTDGEELAFFNTVCLPLYNTLAAAIGAGSPPPTTQQYGTLAEAASGAAAGDPVAQAAYQELLWQQASSSAP